MKRLLNPKRIYCLLLVVLLTQTSSAAESSARAKEALTLRSALACHYELFRNLNRSEFANATADLERARAKFRPELGMTLSNVKDYGDRTSDPARGDASISLNQTIFSATGSEQQSAGERGIRTADLSLKSRFIESTTSLLDRIDDYLSLTVDLELEIERRETLSTLRTFMETAVKIKQTRSIDGLMVRSELNQSNQNIELLKLRIDELRALLLIQMIGKSDRPLKIETSVRDTFGVELEADVLENAIAETIPIQHLKERRGVDEGFAEAARRFRFPEVVAEAGFAKRVYGDRYYSGDSAANGFVALNIKMSLLDRGIQDANKTLALEKVYESDRLIIQKTAELGARVRSLANRIKTNRKLVAQGQSYLELATSVHSKVLTKFRSGLASWVELNQVEIEYLKAKSSLAKIKLRLPIAEHRLGLIFLWTPKVDMKAWSIEQDCTLSE